MPQQRFRYSGQALIRLKGEDRIEIYLENNDVFTVIHHGLLDEVQTFREEVQKVINDKEGKKSKKKK